MQFGSTKLGDPDLPIFAGDDLSTLADECTCTRSPKICTYHSSSAWEGHHSIAREMCQDYFRMRWLREQWKLFEKGETMKLDGLSRATDDMLGSTIPQWYHDFRAKNPIQKSAVNKKKAKGWKIEKTFDEVSEVDGECDCEDRVESRCEFHKHMLAYKPDKGPQALDYYRLREVRENEKIAQRSQRLRNRFDDKWLERPVSEMDELPDWYLRSWRKQAILEMDPAYSGEPDGQDCDDDLSSLYLSEIERFDDDAWEKYCACLEEGARDPVHLWGIRNHGGVEE